MKIARAVLAALLLVAGWAAPAAGVVPPPGGGAGVPAGPVAPDKVHWLTCGGSTGALHALTPQSSDPATAQVDYTFHPCWTGTTTTTVYAVAVYTQSTVVAWASWVGSGTSVVVQVQPGAHAVCLVSSPTQRVACAEVVWGADGLPALGPALPLDAPAVSAPVGTVWKPEGYVIVPVCPVCT